MTDNRNPNLDFATPEQMDAATEDIRVWALNNHIASFDLATLWSKHVMEVGHKRLGRMVMGITNRVVTKT